jgi:hypothetical protein
VSSIVLAKIKLDDYFIYYCNYLLIQFVWDKEVGNKIKIKIKLNKLPAHYLIHCKPSLITCYPENMTYVKF